MCKYWSHGFTLIVNLPKRATVANIPCTLTSLRGWSSLTSCQSEGIYVSTLLWSPHWSILAYSTLVFYTILCWFAVITCQGEGTGAPGWRWCLTGRCGWDGPRNLPDWTFYSLPRPQKHTQTLCSQASLLPRINLKRREKSFTEHFNIILSTHAQPLTSFLKHRPHILNILN